MGVHCCVCAPAPCLPVYLPHRVAHSPHHNPTHTSFYALLLTSLSDFYSSPSPWFPFSYPHFRHLIVQEISYKNPNFLTFLREKTWHHQDSTRQGNHQRAPGWAWALRFTTGLPSPSCLTHLASCSAPGDREPASSGEINKQGVCYLTSSPNHPPISPTCISNCVFSISTALSWAPHIQILIHTHPPTN